MTPTDRLVVDGDELVVDGHKVTDLLSEFGSPLFVVSADVLKDNLQRLWDGFRAGWPTEVSVLYAIKANNNLAIRTLMSNEGAGGDAFSEGELVASIKSGMDMSKMVLNGSDKSEVAIRIALREGSVINVDCIEDVERTIALATEEQVTARVFVRLRLTKEDVEHGAEKYPDVAKRLRYIEIDQLGVPAATAEKLIARLREADNVDLIGFHHHQGRQSRELDHFRWWAEYLGRTIGRLQESTGFTPRVLDIGGGYPRQRDPEIAGDTQMNATTVEEYSAAITSGLLEGLGAYDVPVPELWIEPGRFLVGNASVLLSTVGTIKEEYGYTWVNVDASINNLPRVDNRNFRYISLPATKMNSEPDADVSIVGALCTGGHLAIDQPFPKAERGDVVAFLDAGMYSEVASTQYNAVPRPATVMVVDGTPVVIKRRETLDDVFAAHTVPDVLRGTVANA